MKEHPTDARATWIPVRKPELGYTHRSPANTGMEFACNAPTGEYFIVAERTGEILFGPDTYGTILSKFFEEQGRVRASQSGSICGWAGGGDICDAPLTPEQLQESKLRRRRKACLPDAPGLEEAHERLTTGKVKHEKTKSNK